MANLSVLMLRHMKHPPMIFAGCTPKIISKLNFASRKTCSCSESTSAQIVLSTGPRHAVVYSLLSD